MNVDEQAFFVTHQLIPMLKHDLRLIVESGCPTHGTGKGPQFSIALVCMVACEAIGALSAPAGLTSAHARTRQFIARVDG